MPSTPSRFLEIDREKHCWLKLTFTRDKYRGWGGRRVAIEDGILLRRHKSREWWGAAVSKPRSDLSKSNLYGISSPVSLPVPLARNYYHGTRDEWEIDGWINSGEKIRSETKIKISLSFSFSSVPVFRRGEASNNNIGGDGGEAVLTSDLHN